MSDEKLDLEATREECLRALGEAKTEIALREVFARYGGQKGVIKQAVQDAIKRAPKEEKRSVGERGNEILASINSAFGLLLDGMKNREREEDLRRTVDVTLPGRAQAVRRLGHLHPTTLARREIERIFTALGFTVESGPEVESDFYNFEALAMPPDHPARDMQDTFYVDGHPDLVLRTHTSPVQIRTMLAHPPPIRAIMPGAVYRKDDDPTHSPMFFQVEGLVVDEGVSLADLKGTLLHWVKAQFGEDIGLRLRPSFFPFTEPSAELDIGCVFCRMKGCRLCKGTGYIEIGGCGMVDPEVFRHVGVDAERYTGFAFGFGIDRMAMLLYGINDIKLLFEGDARLLEQFPAHAWSTR